MAVNIDELNSFANTDTGKAWLEQQKAALLENRDQVLSELKKTSGEYSALKLRFDETENALKEERAFITKSIVDRKLESLLNDRHFFKTIIPHCIERLKNGYAIKVLADGENRAAVGVLKDADGNEKQASLEECFEHFYNSPESQDMMPPKNTGGGALGSGSSRIDAASIGSMSGQELARLSDREFEEMRRQTILSF